MEDPMRIAIPVSMSKAQYYINYAYVNFVKNAGFEPMLVSQDNDLATIVDKCDGLLLPGGIDVDPIYYGETNIGSFSTDIKKDEFERSLFWEFAVEDRKIFGVCRGFQLIVREFLNYPNNAETDDYNKLDFVQHIPGHSLAKDREVPRTQPTHWVTVDESLYGSPHTEIAVNSMHHQALLCTFDPDISEHTAVGTEVCDNQLKILAVTDLHVPKKYEGYIVEAVEIKNWLTPGCNIRGVQWHPEELAVNNGNETDLLKTFFNNAHVIEAHQ